MIYKFENGYRREAEIMYRRLVNAGFSPRWEFDVGGMMITLPDSQIGAFRALQAFSPATWGSAPKEV